jgi:hypothetical protein
MIRKSLVTLNLELQKTFRPKLSSGKQYVLDLRDVKQVIQIMGSLDDFQEIYDDDDQTEQVRRREKTEQ